MESQAPVRSPRQPSCGSFDSGRPMRPRPVGVSTAKDLELLGVLPGLAIPERGGRSAGAAGGASMVSMLSSYIPLGGLRAATAASAMRSDCDGRRRDISYLRDRPGHGKQAKRGEWTDVVVPPTKVPESARVVKKSVVRRNDPCCEEWYDPAERLWHRIVFPAKRPSNREQVLLLERWMTTMLAVHAKGAEAPDDRPKTKNNNATTQESPAALEQSPPQRVRHLAPDDDDDGNNAFSPRGRGGVPPGSNASAKNAESRGEIGREGAEAGRGEGRPEVEEKKAAMIRAQMGVLMAGFYEIIRQVTQHCAERGQLLDRIWRSLNDLFEFVLWEMTETVARCERRLADMCRVLERERADKESRDAVHLNELKMVEELLNGRWAKTVGQLRDKEARYGKLVAANQHTVERLAEWLPNFSGYADSVLAKLLPHHPAPEEAEVAKTLSPQEALEKDLRRAQVAGLWAVVPVDEKNGANTESSDGSEREDSIVENHTDSVGSNDERDKQCYSSPMRLRQDAVEEGLAGDHSLSPSVDSSTTASTPRAEEKTLQASRKEKTNSSSGVHETRRPHQQAPAKPQTDTKDAAENTDTNDCGKVQPVPLASVSLSSATASSDSLVASSEAEEAAKEKTNGPKPNSKGKVGGGRNDLAQTSDRKLLSVLVQQSEDAAAEADTLRREVAEAKQNAARVANAAKESAMELLQACGRAQGAILSLMADPAPSKHWASPGLLQLLGMSTMAEQVSTIRATQPLGVASVHFSVVTAARMLITFRREAAASAATSTATADTPAVGNLRPRFMAEFLYEVELRRSETVRKARANLRRLIASLLHWLPSEEKGTSFGAAGAGAGSAAAASHRPPGYGSLPRPIVGHEKTALTQFQRILRIIEGTGNPKGVSADNDDSDCDGNSREAQTTYGDRGGGGGGNGWGSSNFTDAEECLWLRVFGALELYARPCRSDPQQGPTPPDLVPLDKAVSAVEEIFGCRSPGLRSAGSAAGPASQQKTDLGRRHEVANPWLLVDGAALGDTVSSIKTAAAKHGGNHVELFDVTGAALGVGYRANRETLLRVLTLVADVADLAGEVTFGTARNSLAHAQATMAQAKEKSASATHFDSVIIFPNVVMHVASPGLPEPSLRLLFYRAVAIQHFRGRKDNNASAQRYQSGAHQTRVGGGASAADGGGGDGGEVVSAAGFARAVVEFPLPCEGLRPLVASTVSAAGVRDLLKQATLQAKEAVIAAEKIIEAIKTDQGTDLAGGPGSSRDGSGFVPASEISAVEARASQLKAFMTNADASRSALNVSKLWISRRMLAIESSLLRTYGGVFMTMKAQDAIRQGRRVRLRRVFRALMTASREKLMTRPAVEVLLDDSEINQGGATHTSGPEGTAGMT